MVKLFGNNMDEPKIRCKHTFNRHYGQQLQRKIINQKNCLVIGTPCRLLPQAIHLFVCLFVCFGLEEFSELLHIKFYDVSGNILDLCISSKVIIEKSHGEVSLVEPDTIENVSQPIKNQNCFLKKIKKKNRNSFYATFQWPFQNIRTLILTVNDEESGNR